VQKSFYLILLICIDFKTGTICAQEKAVQKNVKVALSPDEENLNVFQQWIRWNNPGSLLLNHLIKQAMEYNAIRDIKKEFGLNSYAEDLQNAEIVQNSSRK